jgi:hypothetical protein
LNALSDSFHTSFKINCEKLVSSLDFLNIGFKESIYNLVKL